MASELEPSSAKIERWIKKGQKVATLFCLGQSFDSYKGMEASKIMAELKLTQPCGALSSDYQTALAYYLASPSSVAKHDGSIVVPHDAKCPVCGMFVYKYPKWSARMVVAGRTYYFDGVKDMMKYYIFDADFPYSRDAIESIEVSDFYTLKAISAKDAYYVIGSNLFGPMGNELIPFENRASAQNFMHDHQGQRIISFEEIDATLVMKLDGVE